MPRVTRARASAGLWSALVLVCACRSDPATAPASSDEGGGGASSTSGTSEGTETTLSPQGACERSSDCSEDAPHCVAPYDPGLGVIGDSVCVSACVGAGDLARACLDDEACCAGLQCNPVDGFCSALPQATTSSSGSDTDTDTSSSTGGATTSSSTGASTSSSTSG